MAKKLSKIEIVKRIVESRQNRRVSWMIEGKTYSSVLDYFSAQTINVVYEALDNEGREKFMACEWPKIVRLAFKNTTLKIVEA